MKATDFRPEHFENGRNFNRNDFNAYVQASDKLARTAYTRYLPSVAVGLLLGLLFSRGVGGFGGNILALVCIFAGLIVGAVFNVKAGKAVNAPAQRLGISKADVALARKHVKNGTFAWTGGEGESQEESPAPADIPDAVLDRPQAATAIPENPLRAVWAAGLLTVGWFLLAVIQSSFGLKLLSSSSAYVCLSAALLGAAVYLMAQNGLKWKLIGAVPSLVSVLLLTSSDFVAYRFQALGVKLRLSLLFSFRDPNYMRTLGNVALAVLLCLAAVLLYSVLRKEKGKNRAVLCGAIGGIVYLAARLLPRLRLLLSMFSHPGIPARQILTQQIYPSLTAALVIFLVCMATDALCRMPQTRVKLRGIGLVWAWLALAGSVFTIFLVLRVGTVSNRVAGMRVTGVYAYQMILGLSALIGYALLLCKRRVGLYFILLGVGLMLGAQLVSALYNLGLGSSWNMLLSTLLGALNPLFAWLAVRAGEVPG